MKLPKLEGEDEKEESKSNEVEDEKSGGGFFLENWFRLLLVEVPFLSKFQAQCATISMKS